MPSELPGTILHNTTNTDPGSRLEGHAPTASAIYNSYPSIHWHTRTTSLTSESLVSPLIPRALPSLPQIHHSDTTSALSGDNINTTSSSSSNTSSWKPDDSSSDDTHILSWNSSRSQSSSNQNVTLSSDSLSIIDHGILPQKRPGKHFRSVTNNVRIISQSPTAPQSGKQNFHRVQHRGSRRFSVKRLIILSSSEDPSGATSFEPSRRYQPSAQSPDDFLSASTSIGNIAGSLSGSLFVPSSAGSNVSSSPVQTTSVSASGCSSQRDLEESELTLESKSSTSIDCSWNESTTSSSKSFDDLPIAPTPPRRYRFPSSLPPSDPISTSSSANSSLSFHLDDDRISALESSSCRSRSSWTASADISSYQHTLSDRESSFTVEDPKATVMGPPRLPQHIREPSIEHPRTRRSVRQQVYPQAYSLLPLGPRHLELEYHLAHKELREAIINSLKDLQYEFPRRSRDQPLTCNEVSELRQLILDANAPYVVQAKNRLDYANRRLDEALALGRTWNNTPISGDLQAPLVYPLFLPGDTESDSRKSAPGAATEMDKCQTNISSFSSSSSSSSKRIKSTTPTSIGPLKRRKRRSSDESEESKYTTY